MIGPSPNEIRQALRGSKDSSQAIKRLYELFKKKDGKFSLAYFCQKAGLASKGYLSEVIAGKKTLNPLYAEGIAKAFDLKGVTASYLKVLTELDQATDEKKIEKLKRKKVTLIKSLGVVTAATLSNSQQDIFFAFQVYSVLGLFQNRTTFAALLEYFGKKNESKLRTTLDYLLDSKLLVQDGEYYAPNYEQVVFSAHQDKQAHFKFLNSCLDKSKAALDEWYSKKSEAYFESSLISVDRAHYQVLLPKIRAMADEMQSQLETPEADQVVLFGIQMFPIKP